MTPGQWFARTAPETEMSAEESAGSDTALASYQEEGSATRNRGSMISTSWLNQKSARNASNCSRAVPDDSKIRMVMRNQREER